MFLIIAGAIALAFLLGSARMLWIAWKAARTGRYEPGRGYVLSRSREPLRYWFAVVLSSVVALGTIWMIGGGIITFAMLVANSK
jgi:hypothetical protein